MQHEITESNFLLDEKGNIKEPGCKDTVNVDEETRKKLQVNGKPNFTALLEEKLRDNFKGEIVLKDETASTNVDASKFATQGKEALIIAKKQTNGKGRFDRTFISEEGGLYFSLVVKTNKKPIEITNYPIRVGQIVKEVIDKLYEVECEIKEPNDVLLEKKKVCGILMEAIPHDDDLFVIIGVGLNIDNKLPKSLPDAGSLKQLTKKEIKTEQTLCNIVIDIINIF